MDNELRRTLQLAGLKEADAPAFDQQAMTAKLGEVITKLAGMYPPEDGNANIQQIDSNTLYDQGNDVGFSATLGIPTTNIITVTRHKATRYEPEDIDEYEEEIITDVPVTLTTEYDQISLCTEYEAHVDGIDLSMDAESILKLLVNGIEKTKLGVEDGGSEHFDSYKEARAKHAADNYDGPDEPYVPDNYDGTGRY